MKSRLVGTLWLLLVFVGVLGCQPPALPPQQPHSQSVNLVSLLEYVPEQWLDVHPVGLLGPSVTFVDFAAMRADLDLPDVTGADTREAKLDLIAEISTQGLDITPPYVYPMGGRAFDEWGWDIADVSQVLYMPSTQISILLGDFNQSGIEAILADRGYMRGDVGELTLLASSEEGLAFALDSSTMIISPEVSLIEDLVHQKANPRHSFAEHPSIRSLLSYSIAIHGAFLASSGDLLSYTRELQEQPPLLPGGEGMGLYEYGWDFMMITFTRAEEITNLSFLYHYQSEDDARADVSIVRDTLTNTPSFRSLGRTWSDLVNLESVDAWGQVVVAQGTTENEALIGVSISQRDEYGFLPSRQLE